MKTIQTLDFKSARHEIKQRLTKTITSILNANGNVFTPLKIQTRFNKNTKCLNVVCSAYVYGNDINKNDFDYVFKKIQLDYTCTLLHNINIIFINIDKLKVSNEQIIVKDYTYKGYTGFIFSNKKTTIYIYRLINQLLNDTISIRYFKRVDNAILPFSN